MEDATVTQESPLVRDRFPSVVDTDDLIFEIGRHAVKNLNLEKLLTKLLEKTKGLEIQLSDIAKQESDNMGKVTSLLESNELYEENNRSLDAEITKIRSEVTKLRIQKDEEIAVLKDSLSRKDEEIKKPRQRKKPVKKK